MAFNTIDLFCGCGGLVEGFLQADDYRTLAAVDWESQTIQTLKNRLEKRWGYSDTEDSILHFDLQRTEELLNGYNDPVYGKSVGLNYIISENIDVIIGGPPCQAYSMAGRVQDKHGMQNDYRNYLFESYVKIVDKYKPKAFIFENVEGIISAKPGGIPITDRIKKAFASIGYEVICNFKNALFDLSYFNVPQSRKRVIIFGVPKSKSSRDKIKKFYSLIEEKRNKEQLTSSVALNGLPQLYPKKHVINGASHEAINDNAALYFNHIPRFHNQRDIDIFRILALDIESGQNKYTSTQALIELYRVRTGKISKFHKYHVIRPDKPSNTIPAHLYKDGLRHIHPDPKQARSITVREAARIQTFPDDFEFLGAKGDQYKMVGNAVPPQFSKMIAETLKEVID